MFARFLFLAILCGSLFFNPAINADISYTVQSSVYSQNFDSLFNSGPSLPWVNDNNIVGWNLYDHLNNPMIMFGADDGNSSVGNFYSYGTGTSSDRALGGLGSGDPYFGSPAAGAVAGYIAVQITNNTGVTLQTALIIYAGEQWRSGGLNPHTMNLEYGFGSTFSGVGTWIAPGGNFDFTSPIVSPVAMSAYSSVSGRGGILSNLNWVNGQSLWIRWVERNDLGPNHGLAIENFQFQAAGSVPETGTISIGIMVWLVLESRSRRRRLSER